MAASLQHHVRRSTPILVLVAALLALLPGQAAAAVPGTSTSTPAQREAAAGAAEASVGRPYAWGAAGPRAFDCSGLVDHAYRVAGAPIGARTSYDMWNLGLPVRRAALQRGDIVWTWDRAKGHVGLYLGGGRYVHAPGAGRRVQIAPLPTGRSFVGAMRP